ncbi:MAG: class I SAM-dependent methyltransferase [Candidatus Peribacteria bacterium]|nr:MAG: class I SAM-dependent methyltransferase [Candidatus Peribacteria bacterium]
MIACAHKEFPKAHLVCSDMLAFLEQQESCSVDCVIGLASLQHLYTIQERVRAFQHLYNVLSYGGRVLLLNRSFSDWFLRKYWKQIVSGVCTSTWKYGWQWNDYMIPWKSGTTDEVYQRYYHIFTLHELEQLARLSGFKLIEACYVQSEGEKTIAWREGRNTLVVLEKGV